MIGNLCMYDERVVLESFSQHFENNNNGNVINNKTIIIILIIENNIF